jgi:predicted O-linked N-acetylglucosamine transferase (SPINDLY family)
MASRQTAAWLAMAGKSEWIASDAASYVDIAVALAGDGPTRRAWRAEARDVLRPAITDSERFAREFIDAIRAVAITPH